MTLTLGGRFQTRVLLILLFGVPWTIIVSPFLTLFAPAGLPAVYRMTLSALAIVLGVGFVWDILYYCLQQFRWDKDWPSSFGLLNGVNEGLTTWIGLRLLATLHGWFAGGTPTFTAFAIHFSTTWLLLWLAMQGPLRIIVLRWRFTGGRIL